MMNNIIYKEDEYLIFLNNTKLFDKVGFCIYKKKIVSESVRKIKKLKKGNCLYGRIHQPYILDSNYKVHHFFESYEDACLNMKDLINKTTGE